MQLRSRPPICPVCLSANTSLFFRNHQHCLVRCKSCETVHLHPLPAMNETRELYRDPYQGATTSYFAKTDKKLQRSRNRIRSLIRYVPSGRFLDVGCSGGFMVEAAREAGFEAWGLDLDKYALFFAREHYPQNTYFFGTIEDFITGVLPGQFDLIYSSEVIEHVPDVRSFCKSISDILRPGGILFMTTPDISHWRRPKDVTKWDGFGPPAHCVYFTPTSLIRLLDVFKLILIRRRLAFKPGIKLICRKEGRPNDEG
jgi:SAM-dependent methyltransferase